jgi:hypothetical protein
MQGQDVHIGPGITRSTACRRAQVPSHPIAGARLELADDRCAHL